MPHQPFEIKRQQGFLIQAAQELADKKGVALRLLMHETHQFEQIGLPGSLPRQGVAHECLRVLSRQILQIYRLDRRSRRFDALHRDRQRVRGRDFVLPIRRDDQQMMNACVCQQRLKQIDRRQIRPLPVVNEYDQRMLRLRHRPDQIPQGIVEPVLRRNAVEFRHVRLGADNQFQRRREVNQHAADMPGGLLQGVAPDGQFGGRFRQQQIDKFLRGLHQRKVRDIALKLVEFALNEMPALHGDRFVDFIHQSGLADSGVSGDHEQFAPPRLTDALKGLKQLRDLRFSAI